MLGVIKDADVDILNYKLNYKPHLVQCPRQSCKISYKELPYFLLKSLKY